MLGLNFVVALQPW